MKQKAVFGEYTIVEHDSGSIEVYKVYDNVKGALRELADLIGFEFDAGWTTRQFGSKIIKAIEDGQFASLEGAAAKTFAEYLVTKNNAGSIEVLKTYGNTKGALREVAEANNFEFDANWTTRQFGSKLIKQLNA